MRSCEPNVRRSSLINLEAFAVTGYQLNFVRGGGDPIPPPIGGGHPGWQDDGSYTPDAP